MRVRTNPGRTEPGLPVRHAQEMLASLQALFAPPYIGWVYVLGALVILAVGASGELISETYAPVLVGGAVISVALVLLWLRDPLWALLPAIIIIFLPQGLIPAEMQSIGNRVLTVATLGCWAANLLFGIRLAGQRTRQLLRWPLPTMLFALFFTWSLLTLLWAQSLNTGMEVVQVYAMRLILFLILIPNLVTDHDALKKFLGGIAITGWILLIASYWVAIAEGYTPGTRLQVFDTNANGLGVQAVISAVGMLWWSAQPGRARSWRMVLGAIYLVLSMGLVAMSGSRGSSITLALMLLFLWLQKPTRVWGNIALVLLVLALPVLPVVFDTLITRFNVTTDDTALGGREVIWEAAFRTISDDPIRGAGIGNGSLAVRPHLQVLKGVSVSSEISLHNPLLTIWVETGLPGLLLYGGVLLSAALVFFRQYVQYVQYLHQRAGLRLQDPAMQSYFALVTAVFAGYMVSWFKGGGMEKEFSYFYMLALLILPSVIPAEQDAAAGVGDVSHSYEVP